MKKELLCLDCGHYFSISLGTMKRYKKRGQHIPTHCPACREIRWKEERQEKKRAIKFERNKRYDGF